MVHELKAAQRNPSHDDLPSHPSLIDEVIDHCKHTWSDVGHGKGNLGENLEVGTEVLAGTVAGAVLARFGLSKLLPAAEKLLPAAEKTIPNEVSLNRFGDPWYFRPFPEIEEARARIAVQVAREYPTARRVELAEMPEMDPERLAIMAHDPAPSVRLAVIRHPNTPYPTLKYMYKTDESSDLRNEAYIAHRNR